VQTAHGAGTNCRRAEPARVADTLQDAADGQVAGRTALDGPDQGGNSSHGDKQVRAYAGLDEVCTGVLPTIITPKQMSSTPLHRTGLTCSPANRYPSAGASAYPAADAGST